MTVDRAIEVLTTDMGCYSCTFGCDAPYKCLNDSCEFKEAIHLAVKLLPKIIIRYERGAVNDGWRVDQKTE